MRSSNHHDNLWGFSAIFNGLYNIGSYSSLIFNSPKLIVVFDMIITHFNPNCLINMDVVSSILFFSYMMKFNRCMTMFSSPLSLYISIVMMFYIGEGYDDRPLYVKCCNIFFPSTLFFRLFTASF